MDYIDHLEKKYGNKFDNLTMPKKRKFLQELKDVMDSFNLNKYDKQHYTSFYEEKATEVVNTLRYRTTELNKIEQSFADIKLFGKNSTKQLYITDEELKQIEYILTGYSTE